MTVNDIPVSGYFRVYDMTTQRTIFHTFGGDIPPEIAMLEVIRVYAVDSTIYMDVKT